MKPDKVDLDAFYSLAEIKEDIYNFIKNGKNLYIYSTNTGNGKTTWLSKLLKSYFNQIWAGNGFKTRGYYIDLPIFFIELKEAINNPNEELDELKQFLKSVDVLCIDSLIPMSFSEFELNYLTYIVENRINDGLSTIYGASVDEDNLLRYYGTRLKSRIFNNSKIIRLQGTDKRGL